MNKRGIVLLAFMLFLILIINFAVASFTIGKPAYSIDEKYGISQGITGWINISVNNENTSSMLVDSLNNEISLLNLLKLNPGFNYSCNPKDCKDYYYTTNAQTAKNVAGNSSSCIIGDVNGDGKINNTDSDIVLNIVTSGTYPSNICCADVSKNGEISVYDSSLILQIIAGTATSPGTCTGTSTGNKYYGMLFSGELASIDSISFDVSAKGVPASCNSQFKIDIFDDGNIDFQNTIADSEICPGSRTYGCYYDSTTSEQYTLDSDTIYCQKLTLPVAPGFRLGAWVKKESGSRDVSMSLYDKDGNEVENGICALPAASSSGSEIYCDVNYSVKELDDYYVCIFSDAGDGNYKIKGYDQPVDGCGFFGEPPIENAISSYDIFAEAKKFAALSSTVIPMLNDMDTGESLNSLTENYIIEKNGNFSCQNGCIVPIKFLINTSFENLGINNIKIDYSKSSGKVTGNSIYDLTVTPAKIIFGYGKLYLDGSGLKVKSTTGDFTYTLKLSNKKIFSETLTVQKGPEIKTLIPTSTTYLFPTKFKVNVTFTENISRYDWNFGDNSTETTTTNRATHTYDESGIYTLKVVVKDKNNISSSKTFSINVTSPVLLINKTIEKMKTDISNVKNQIDSYDLFYRTSLNSQISISNLSSDVKALEDRYKKGNESDYRNIVTELSELKIPERILVSQSAPDYVFYPMEGDVNVDVMKEIEEGSYTESDTDYVNSIYVWNTENMVNNLVFEELSAKYAAESEPLLRVFKFKASQKNVLSYDSYFVIKNMENLEFKENYGEKSADGYKYIVLTGGANEIVFTTTEDVNFENVPAFISPGLSKLSVVDSSGILPGDESTFPTKTFIWVIVIVLVVGIAAYVALHMWYKKRYEEHLFRNKNDLYNMLHFIDSQRKKGVLEKDIHEKLKKSGWSSEQIRFATRKHSGKKTGMPGLSIW